MKNIIAAAILLGTTATLAETIELPVIYSTPVTTERWITKQVPTTVNRCVTREVAESRGWIQKGTNKVFGSTQGLLGALIGGAIGNQIGGGNGKKIATGLGVILGNQVGNNMADQERGTVCRDVTEYREYQQKETTISHYRVTVEVNGQRIVLERQTDPGATVPINIQ